MALTATQLQEVAAITTQHINDEIPDLFVAQNGLYTKMYGRKNKVSGGTFIQMPIAGVAELGSQGFITGTAADNLNLNINQIVTYGQLNWKFFYWALTFDLKELTITEGTSHAIKSLVKTKANFAKGSIARTLSAALYATDTGNNSNQFTGFGSIFAASGTAYAQINNNDIANWLPYYPSNISATNYANISPTLDVLRSRSQQDGATTTYRPDLILSDTTEYNAFKVAESLKLRFAPSDMMKAGFTGIQVDGFDWLIDTNSPAATIWALTSESFELFYKYGFDGEKSPLDDPMLRVPQQPTKSEINFMAGNIGCTNRRVNAKILRS